MGCLLVCLYPSARNFGTFGVLLSASTCLIMEQGLPQSSWHTSCVPLAQGACKQQQKALAALKSVATVRFDSNKAMALP
jgi:hypothetical protein